MASAVDQRSCYLVEGRWEQEEGTLLVERTYWELIKKNIKMNNFLMNCVGLIKSNLNTTQFA